MLANLETPRPLPPAKARKASAMQRLLKTPPPAYGSPFTFPARRQGRHDILGSPLSSTFQMVGWDREEISGESELAAPDDDLMNEKSREELRDLLLKADEIIKERENELGITSAVCKGLYQNNVALKSKHQALLARLPISPPRSTSSPGNLFHHASSRESTISLATSSSESALGLIRSPQPTVRHSRKVSIATADISLLADQNAELLDKLEKLEVEATSADHAGRRELKRLEKEIDFLREALEKTQARSEELESKVQGAIVNEAWRRKKEREAKFKAMRNLGRDASSNEVRNFAPEGSRFGGPSDTFSFFPTAESPDLNRRLDSSSSADTDLNLGLFTAPEHSIIAQLLTKVKELEEANTRILQQQSDTASQLSAVQRDTAHITKVYECLSDPEFGDLELEHSAETDNEEKVETKTEGLPSRQTIRFVSLKRNIQEEMSFDGTCIVHPIPEFMSAAKNRKSVMGLFDELPDEEGANSSEDSSAAFDAKLRAQLSLSPWSDGHDRSTWSSVASTGAAHNSAALSPLHFFSPPSHVLPELSPLGARSTLQHELDREFGHGASWENAAAGVLSDPEQRHLHLRTSSLYDISQFSVPPSPSPPPRTMSRRGSDELDFEAIRRINLDLDADGETSGNPRAHPPGLLMPLNSLQLSVQPPTPEKKRTTNRSGDNNNDDDNPERITVASSPRVKMISEVLRSRSSRWNVDRRLRHRKRSRSRETGQTRAELAGLCELDCNSDSVATSSAHATGLDESVPRRLMNAVDNMIDGFTGSEANVRGSYDLSDEEDEEEYYYEDGDDDSARHFDPTPLTPKARSRHDHSNSNPTATGDDNQLHVQLHGASPPKKSSGDADHHSGLLFQVWLWIQFAIVVFVFLYAMARRGPAVVLTEGENKRGAVARRR